MNDNNEQQQKKEMVIRGSKNEVSTILAILLYSMFCVTLVFLKIIGVVNFHWLYVLSFVAYPTLECLLTYIINYFKDTPNSATISDGNVILFTIGTTLQVIIVALKSEGFIDIPWLYVFFILECFTLQFLSGFISSVIASEIVRLYNYKYSILLGKPFNKCIAITIPHWSKILILKAVECWNKCYVIVYDKIKKGEKNENK